MIFTDQATFLSELNAGSFFNDFSSLTADTAYPSPQSYSGNGFAYDVTATGDLCSGNGTDSWIGANFPETPTTVTFTSGNVTAIGLNAFSTSVINEISTGPISVVLGSGESQSFLTTSLTTFIGFISTDPIDSVVVSVDGNFGFYSTFTNLYVGQAAIVPEPSTLALAGLGILGGVIALAGRKKQIIAD